MLLFVKDVIIHSQPILPRNILHILIEFQLYFYKKMYKDIMKDINLQILGEHMFNSSSIYPRPIVVLIIAFYIKMYN